MTGLMVPPAPPMVPPAPPKAPPPRAPSSPVPPSPSPHRQATAAGDAILTSMHLDAELNHLGSRLDNLGSQLNVVESSVGSLLTEQKRLSGQVQEIIHMMASMKNQLDGLWMHETQMSTRMVHLLTHISKKASESSGSRSGSLEEKSPAQRELQGQPRSQIATGTEIQPPNAHPDERDEEGTSVSGSLRSWSHLKEDTIQTAMAAAEAARSAACGASTEVC